MAKFGPGWAWVLTYEEPFDMTITKTLCPVGLITFPMTVAGLTAVTETAGIRLSWTLSTDAPVTSFYRVKRGNDWGSAVLVADNVTANNTSDPNVFNGTQYTYLVKGVSPTGRESQTAATVTITATGVEQANVVLNDVEEPDWLGTKTNMIVQETYVLGQLFTGGTASAATDTGSPAVPYEGTAAADAFDGSGATYWQGTPFQASTYFQQRLVYQLAVAANIRWFRIKFADVTAVGASFSIGGSSDGITYGQITKEYDTSTDVVVGEWLLIPATANPNDYDYYCLFVNAYSDETHAIQVTEFEALDNTYYLANFPTDSNDWFAGGTASANFATTPGNPASNGFDKNTGTMVQSDVTLGSQPTQYVQYDRTLADAIIPKELYVYPYRLASGELCWKGLRLDGYNDTEGWVQLFTGTVTDNENPFQRFIIETTGSYYKFRIYCTSVDTLAPAAYEFYLFPNHYPETSVYVSTPYDIGQKWWSYVNVEANATLNIEDGGWADYFPAGGTWGDAFPDESAGWEWLQSSGIVAIELAFTDDDPAGAPTWGPWVPFEQKKYNFRGVKCRVSAAIQNAKQTFKLEGLRTICDVDDVTIHVPDFQIAAGGSTLTYASYNDTVGRAGAFLNTPISIKGQPRDVGGAISIDIPEANRTATSCKVVAYNVAESAVASAADVTIIGY